VYDTDTTSLSELADSELDLVGAGNLVNISVGLQFANQQNISLFSLAQQGGAQGQNQIVNSGNLVNVQSIFLNH